MIFTCSHDLEHAQQLAPFHPWHSDGGLDGPRDSPAVGGNAKRSGATIKLAWLEEDGEELNYLGIYPVSGHILK